MRTSCICGVSNMQKMPDIVLKRKRLSKTKTVVIFRRNNLSFNDFKKTDRGYVFEEKFKHHGVNGSIKLIVESDNLYDAFEINTKTVKVKGGKDHLGIFLRFGDQKSLPLNKTGSMGCIRYELNCEGKQLYYDGKKKSEPGAEIHDTSKRKSISAPVSVSWAASHPFQGGGFSPR